MSWECCKCMVRIHFQKFQLSCDSFFNMNKWSKFKKKTLECIRLPGKKQFTSLFGMKKRQTVHFAYDTNGIPDPAAQSQMRLRKRSQSLPVNKFNPKFILVNRERTKLRYHHTPRLFYIENWLKITKVMDFL